MARKSKNDPRAVDAYLATLPETERDALEQLRTLIKETVPQVEERISLWDDGDVLAGQRPQWDRVAAKTSVVLHGSPKLAAAMKDEITKTHGVSGATIHFSTDNPLPTRLVEKILRARVRENAALREVRSQKRPGSRGHERHPTHQRFR